MLINLRTKFQGFPTQLSQSLVGKNQEQVYEILTIAVEKLLAEMSEYNPKLFDTEIEDEEYVSPDWHKIDLRPVQKHYKKMPAANY